MRLAVLALAALPALAADWNARAAAGYLDARQQQWRDWRVSDLDAGGGKCLSCHTG